MTTVASNFANSGQRSSAGSALARSKASRTNRQITGANIEGSNRERDDFYRTDPETMTALLRLERFDGPVWEPACGDGAISTALQADGYTVISTDLVDRGFGEPRRDFLMERKRLAPTIITNPPFKLADQFIRHSLEILRVDTLVLLLRLQFLEGDRGGLLDQHPPTRVYSFGYRARCYRADGSEVGLGAGMIAFAWFIWRAGHAGPTTLHRIRKPAKTDAGAAPAVDKTPLGHSKTEAAA